MINRIWTLVFGPEAVVGLLTLVVFWFCASHNSGAGRDLQVLEKLVMLLPLIFIPLVFATVFVPGAKNWWWYGRAIAFTLIGLTVCAARIIHGFGDGAKGQDAAFFLVLGVGIVLVSLAAAVSGAMILAATKPAVAEWFRLHRFGSSLLTLLAAAPIGFALGIVATMLIALFAGLSSVFDR